MFVLEASSPHAPSDVAAIAQTIMQRLEVAWNRADGAAFGEPFSTGADFVAIRGDLHTGRAAGRRARLHHHRRAGQHHDQYEISASHNTLVTG